MHGYTTDSDSDDEYNQGSGAAPAPAPGTTQVKAKKKPKMPPQPRINRIWKRFSNRKFTKALAVLPFSPVQPSAVSDRANEVLKDGYERAATECRRKVEKIIEECRRVNMRYRDPGWDLDWDLKYEKGYCLNSLGRTKFELSMSNMLNPSALVPKAVKRVHEIFEKPTFMEKLSGSEVKQGSVGDCWLMASLSGLANVPDGLQRICVKYDTRIGIYGFVFYRDGEWIYSIIDDKLYLKSPCWDSPSMQRDLLQQIDREDVERVYRKTYQTGSKALFFAKCKDQNETWAPLVEKAYAKAHGDYASLSGGWIGEGLEDLSGGVTTELLASDILDLEGFWEKELSRVNEEFLFGCSTGLLDGGYGDREGISEGHAYVVIEARTLKNGTQLVKLRNPWGKNRKGIWEGAWSDGSQEWTTEVQEELGHSFGNDSVFWISYEDLLRKYQHFDRTRLFRDADWRCCQRWLGVEVPWKPQFNEKLQIKLTRESPLVLVLSQLDARYFKGLTGQYTFRLHFRLHERGRPGAEDYIVRSHGNYLMDRSVSIELPSMLPGEYSVFISVAGERDTAAPSVEDVVRRECKKRAENEKLAQVGHAYDLAHSKGVAHLEAVARARKKSEQEKASASRRAERRKMWEQRHKNREITRKQKEKNKQKAKPQKKISYREWKQKEEEKAARNKARRQEKREAKQKQKEEAEKEAEREKEKKEEKEKKTEAEAEAEGDKVEENAKKVNENDNDNNGNEQKAEGGQKQQLPTTDINSFQPSLDKAIQTDDSPVNTPINTPAESPAGEKTEDQANHAMLPSAGSSDTSSSPKDTPKSDGSATPAEVVGQSAADKVPVPPAEPCAVSGGPPPATHPTTSAEKGEEVEQEKGAKVDALTSASNGGQAANTCKCACCQAIETAVVPVTTTTTATATATTAAPPKHPPAPGKAAPAKPQTPSSDSDSSDWPSSEFVAPGDSSDSPVSDYEALYDSDDMCRKPRLVATAPVPGGKWREESEDDKEPDPWNAICIVGFRVYSKDEGLELRVVLEGGELEEGGMGEKGEADLDNAQANAGGERGRVGANDKDQRGDGGGYEGDTEDDKEMLNGKRTGKKEEKRSSSGDKKKGGDGRGEVGTKDNPDDGVEVISSPDDTDPAKASDQDRKTVADGFSTYPTIVQKGEDGSEEPLGPETDPPAAADHPKSQDEQISAKSAKSAEPAGTPVSASNGMSPDKERDDTSGDLPPDGHEETTSG